MASRFVDCSRKHRVHLTIMAPVALLVLAWVVGPHQRWLGPGMVLVALGQALRIWAAGTLVKGNGHLTSGGPFAFTRNPLYLGSSIIGAGYCLLSGIPATAAVVIPLFWVLYLPTIAAEEEELRTSIGGSYEAYLKAVPRVWPTWPRYRGALGNFNWRQAMRNREYEALLANAALTALFARAACG